MQFGLKKKPVFSTYMRGRGVGLNQLIEPVLWVDGVASGKYQKPPEAPCFVSFDHNPETVLALAEMYPEWTFYTAGIQVESSTDSLQNINALKTGQLVQHIYLGNRLSFAGDAERRELLQFVQAHLAPGGYVVVGYEDAAGWSTYKVVIDVLRELLQSVPQAIDAALLDKLFFELYKLSEHNIAAFKSREALDKLLAHLKEMPTDHREMVLRSAQFCTYYPGDVHRVLSSAIDQEMRFVGALPIVRNYLHLGMNEGQKQFIGQPEMTVLAAQRQDLILMPLHRVDIWQRPGGDSNNQGDLSDFYLGCVSDFDHFAPEVSAGHLKLKYSDAIYTRLREICNAQFQSIEAIVKQATEFVRSPQEAANRLMLLVVGGQLAYTRTPPEIRAVPSVKHIGKLKFLHVENMMRFSKVETFVETVGSVVLPGKGLVIPFDQKTSAVLAALTKVHESMVPQYCADVWARFDSSLDMEAIVREFKSVLSFFKRHYLGKFLAMGVVDRVLVDEQYNRNEDTWNQTQL